MTEKLYYKNAFLGEFEATVQSCTEKNGNFEIVLDKTAFFGEGGGQSADTGTLNGIDVIDVFEKDGEIFHKTKTEIKAGTTVYGKLDMNVRLRKMQNHTGEHMVSGTAHNLFGANNFGFHLGQGFFTCDLDVELDGKRIKQIEDTVNMLILENRKVYATVYENQASVDVDYRSKVDFESQVRILTIEGCDACACCAPHVECTAQVGIVKIIDSIKYKGGTRLTAVCGLDALADYRMLCEQNASIMQALSAKRNQTADAVLRAVKERDDVKFECEKYKTLYLETVVKQAEEKGEKTVLIEQSVDANALTAGINAFSGNGAIFCQNGDALSFAVRGEADKMNELIKEIKKVPASSGGGRDGFVRGRISLSYDNAKELFLKYL